MSNQSKYLCPICGADNMCTDFTDGFKWGRAYCNSCDCAGPEVRTGYEESLDAPWRTEARKQFADVANEYAINQFADDTNVARSPWVKTSDRLPTEADGVVVAWGNIEIPEINDYGYAFAIREMFLNPLYNLPYWMPIPPLPEVENEL